MIGSIPGILHPAEALKCQINTCRRDIERAIPKRRWPEKEHYSMTPATKEHPSIPANAKIFLE